MDNVYITADDLYNLSNRELIKKYCKLNQIMSNCKKLPKQYRQQLFSYFELYENEMKQRMDNDLIEEDEIESLYEYYINSEIY